MERYAEFVRGLHLGVIFLRLEDLIESRTFWVEAANPAAVEMIGSASEELVGRTLADLPKAFQSQIHDGCFGALQAGEARNLGEISYGDEREHQGLYSVRVFPLSGHSVAVVLEDITRSRLAELTLRENEERLRLHIKGVREYALFQLDPGGHVVSWNAGAERLKGYREDEITGKHFSVFYPPEDVQSGRPQRNLEEAKLYGQCEDEGWRARKDGSRFWANVLITAVRDVQGNLRGFAKLTRDVTQRREQMERLRKANEELERRVEQRAATLTKVNHELRVEIAEREHVEAELRTSLDQLRALAGRLQRVREEERTNVAREIHDELGQTCTAIKMDLALISRKTTKRQQQLRAKATSAVALVDDMIAALRRIASELRPRTLDDLGLSAALEWQAHEFESRTGIQCRMTLPKEALALDSERSTAIFRIFQESLTNVARHANATQVEARLEMQASRLVFQVRDNGAGFDANEAKGRRSLGLVGMQERALLLNGDLQVEGTPGAGTTVTLRIPMGEPSLK